MLEIKYVSLHDKHIPVFYACRNSNCLHMIGNDVIELKTIRYVYINLLLHPWNLDPQMWIKRFTSRQENTNKYQYSLRCWCRSQLNIKFFIRKTYYKIIVTIFFRAMVTLSVVLLWNLQTWNPTLTIQYITDTQTPISCFLVEVNINDTIYYRPRIPISCFLVETRTAVRMSRLVVCTAAGGRVHWSVWNNNIYLQRSISNFVKNTNATSQTNSNYKHILLYLESLDPNDRI